MIFKSIVLLLSINSFVLPNEYDLLGCFYNRYMIFYFTVHQQYFENIFETHSSCTFDKLKEYNDEYQTQGNIVIAMLEDLKNKNQVTTYPSALMSINLYMNNVFGTLLVRTFIDINNNKLNPDDYKQNTIFKVQIRKSHEKIISEIFKCINKICLHLKKGSDKFGDENINDEEENPFQRLSIARDTSIPSSELFEDLNDLLPISVKNKHKFYDTERIRDLVQQLNYNNFNISNLLNIANKNFENSVFHPKQMLFHNLLSRKKYMDGEMELKAPYDDYIEILRGVAINEKLENGNYANIMILFDMSQRLYEVDFIKSFQQQVLAASVHPVLECIGSYLSLVKQIFYPGKNSYGNVVIRAEAHGEEIDKSGDSVRELLKKFIELKILPEKVQKHLEVTSNELDKLIHFNDKTLLKTKKPKWIDLIYTRCSLPMKLNLLLFYDIDKLSMDMDSAKDVNKMINTLNTKITKVNDYITALNKYQKDFQQILNENPFISHRRMFVDGLEVNIVLKCKKDYSMITQLIADMKIERLNCI